MKPTMMVYKRVDEIFNITTGDYHATKELDAGNVPLISCGEVGHGLVGHFDIPKQKTYHRSITVAYNGQPLLAKFHPYTFGAKDDVAVLIPISPMQDTTQLYIAAIFNRLRWRYHYNRKCFRGKLSQMQIQIPVVRRNGEDYIDEKTIAEYFSKNLDTFIPTKNKSGSIPMAIPKWHVFNITELFDIKSGDFHSMADLDPGKYITISSGIEDNGFVGYFDRPVKANIYKAGLITVGTVGGDAFVQLKDFIATDNIVICLPKRPLRITTIFFISYMLNRNKWRYSYNRKCYKTKFSRVKIPLPVTSSGDIEESYISTLIENTSYWQEIKRRQPEFA